MLGQYSDRRQRGQGEDIGRGLLGRHHFQAATRKMLDEIRPNETVTICLPLFLAGGAEERGFAEAYPTIAVECCDSNQDVLGIEDISGASGCGCS